MENKSGTPLNMLIVDDEPYSLEGLHDLFPWIDWGVRIVALARDGSEALEYIRINPVDVVLSDIRMLGMDGLSLARIVRGEFPRIRIILLSAFADFEYAREALRYGVKEYLVKPVQYQSLADLFVPAVPAPPRTARSPYQGYYPEIIKSVQQFIEANPDTVSLESAAWEIGFSPGYLSRIFHEYARVTFSEYLNVCRMRKAGELIQSGLPIDSAASRVGYGSLQNFSRAFRKYYGVTPVVYRLNTTPGIMRKVSVKNFRGG
ncbi:MAG: response regulator [Treponema sp.]|jgi:two-component system response regulator YesN|nr:response regulator [Treponema sp.]